VKKGPGLVLSLVVIGLGFAIAIPSIIGVIRPFAHTINAPTVGVPGSFSEHLGKGHYAIYEVTPTLPLSTDEVTVRSADGQFLPTNYVVRGDEFDRGGDQYRAVIRFDTPQRGSYQFTIHAPGPTKIIVAKTFGQAIHEAAKWVLPLVLGILAGIAGAVMLVVGIMRRRAQQVPAAPAPGWYVDPQDASRWRYWDGVQWTEHRSGEES